MLVIRDAALTVPLDLFKRLVGAAAGIAPDPSAVADARAEIAQVEAALDRLRADGEQLGLRL